MDEARRPELSWLKVWPSTEGGGAATIRPSEPDEAPIQPTVPSKEGRKDWCLIVRLTDRYENQGNNEAV